MASTPNEARTPRRALFLSLLLSLSVLAVVAAATPVSAANCSDDPDAAQVSVRPHKISKGIIGGGSFEPTELVSASVAGIETPYQEQNCQGPCPGKPYIVGVAQPNNLLTPENVVAIGVCSIVSPIDEAGPVDGALYHKFCSVVIDGFLDENQDCESTGGPAHGVLEDFGL